MSNTVPEGWSLREAESLYKRLRVPRVYDRNQVTQLGVYPVLDQSESGCIGWLNDKPEFDCSAESPLTTFANHTCAVRQMDRPFGVIQNVFPLKAQDDVCQGFLFQILRGAIPQDGYKGHYPQLRETQFLTPPLPEQQKIAAILSSVDDVIEKTRAQIDKLKDLKTGMMQELLTKGIGHTAFKDSPVGRIPEGWEVCTLGDVTEESAFGPRFSSDFYSEKGRIGCIRTTDIDENWDIDYSTVPLADLEYEDFESHFLKDGDLLVTRSGTCGVVDVFKEQPVPMVAAAFLIRFRLSRKVNPWFIRYAMMSADIQESVQMLASGGVQKNLSGTNLKTLLLPLPSESEQDKIVECIRSVSDKIAQIESRRRQLDLIKKALMQDLLTGKVRVNVDNKENAVA